MRFPLLYGVEGKSDQLTWLTAAGVAQREFMLRSLLRRYVCVSVILGWVWHLMKHNCLCFRLDKPKMWNLFPITPAVPMATGSLWVPGETDINNMASFSFFGASCVCNRFRNILLILISLIIKNGKFKPNFNACMKLTHSAGTTSMEDYWICLQWIGLAAIFLSLEVANSGDVTFLEIQESHNVIYRKYQVILRLMKCVIYLLNVNHMQ